LPSRFTHLFTDSKFYKNAKEFIERLNRHIYWRFFSVIFPGGVAGHFRAEAHRTGKVIAGTTLYAGKIPVAAVTFWLFRVSKEKLMTFVWFKQAYDY